MTMENSPRATKAIPARRAARDWKKVEAEQREERFLSAQADAFAGAKAEEKVGPLRSVPQNHPGCQ